MSRANEKRRESKLLSAWSMDGTIFGRLRLTGDPSKSSNWRTSRICSPLRSILGEGKDLSGSMTYLFILLAKRFSRYLLCCCVYLFVCVVWIVHTLVSFCIFFFFLRNLIRFSLFYRVICIRVVCPNLTSCHWMFGESEIKSGGGVSFHT